MDILVENKLLRRNVSFIRIGNKNYTSYAKTSQQYNSGHLFPVINTCHLSRMFLQFIKVDISYSICWNDCINRYNKVICVSISMASLIDNSPVLSTKYPLL